MIDTTDKNQEKTRKRVYWTTLISTFLLLQLGLLLLTIPLDLAGGTRANIVSGSALILYGISAAVASAACRRRKIGLDRISIEHFTAPRPGADLPDAEIRDDPADYKKAAATVATIALLIVAAVRFLPSVPGTEIYGYLMAVCVFCLALGFWYAGATRRGFTARADATGLTTANGLQCKFLPWEQVASVTITTMHDVFGKPAHITLKFTDDREHERATLRLFGDSLRQATPFITHVRARCGGEYDENPDS